MQTAQEGVAEVLQLIASKDAQVEYHRNVPIAACGPLVKVSRRWASQRQGRPSMPPISAGDWRMAAPQVG